MNKRGMLNKRGDFQLSFGMIFSIIMIIAFVAVAIWAILVFVDIGECAETGVFKSDLQKRINTAWNSPESDDVFSGSLPNKVEHVCFADFSSEKKGEYRELYDDLKREHDRNLEIDKNLFFYPLGIACEGGGGFELEHIDIQKITETNNPYCIKNTGKVSISLHNENGSPVLLK